jgi:carboxypeptidase C (cathepsin A)
VIHTRQFAASLLIILLALGPSASLAQENQGQGRRGQAQSEGQGQRPPGAPQAQGQPPGAQQQPQRPAPPAEDKISRSRHSIRIGEQQINYTANTGTMVLRAEDGTPRANIFFIAYLRDDADAASRPVTFTFNGGPGSSSVWLHLGTFGPKRVLMDDNGFPLPPPYKLVDNEHSILDVTDLVFIDPVTTGYSRAIPGENARQFHGFREDIESVAEFIRLWTVRNARWSSPKFLAGESYGTTRAAGLSGELQRRHGMFLNGIVLVSAILNFLTARFDVGNDMPYILFLPTYTATAWYHKKLPADLQGNLRKTLDEAEKFALGEYTQALMAGDTLTPEQRGSVARKVARLTGLSPEFVEQANLRVEIGRFCKELQRNERRTTGRLDSRFTGIDLDAAGERNSYDPSNAAIQGPYTATINDYLRNALKFDSDLPYEVLTGRVQPWSYEQFQNRYVNVAETLRDAMSQNRALKVFVAKGYYDLATPYFAAEYTVNHMGLDPALRKNISGNHYEAGHMMYIHKPSLVQLKKDVAAFIRGAVPK